MVLINTMKQEIQISIRDVYEGLIETREIFLNPFSENLEIHNFCVSSIFRDWEVMDDRDRLLETQAVPINNRRDWYYAVSLIDPVLPGRKFTVKMRGRLDQRYFEMTTVNREDLYFWQISHTSVRKSELIYQIRLSDSFRLVHVQGQQPGTQDHNQASWEIPLSEGQFFNPVVVYRKVNPSG